MNKNSPLLKTPLDARVKMTMDAMFGSDSPNSPERAILDAARRCYNSQGVAKTGMREVAEEAGIARSTLYRYFASKDDVMIAVVLEEALATNETVASQLGQVDGYDSLADFIVEGMILALREIPRRPILTSLFMGDANPSIQRRIWQSKNIVALGMEIMKKSVEPAIAAGILRDEVSPDLIIEWVHRILLSFLTLPSNCITSEDDMRAALHAMLIPVLLK